MKFNSVSSTPDPSKAALSDEIAAQVAEWEAKNGKVQTIPLKALSHDGRTISKGRVELRITKQAWKEA